jgi:hypothetical protein
MKYLESFKLFERKKKEKVKEPVLESNMESEPEEGDYVIVDLHTTSSDQKKITNKNVGKIIRKFTSETTPRSKSKNFTMYQLLYITDTYGESDIWANSEDIIACSKNKEDLEIKNKYNL